MAADKVTFDQQVMPILRQHCQACHSQDDASGGLALDDYSAALAGGAGGEVLAAGDVDGSRLWKLINHEEEPAMPPGGDKIPADQLAMIRAWIEGGLLKDADSKPKASAKPAIAQVAADPTGKPIGEPAMPTGLVRQPIVASAVRTGPVTSLAASRWAPVVAVPWQRQVSFYNSQTNALLGVVPFVDGAPQVVRFSRDGSLLLVAGGRHGSLGNAALYDVKSGAKLASLGDELDIVLAADISPDKSLVAIGGPKKKVRVYRTADGEKSYELSKHTDWITAVAFSPDGKLLATGDRVSGLLTWDAAAGHERNDLRGHNDAITSLAWRADSAVMASTSEDGSLKLWNTAGAPIKSSGAHGGGALSVAFAADGRLVTTGRDKQVKLWKPDGNHEADLGPMRDVTLAAVFTHDDARVVASDYTGEVRVIDIESKKTVAKLTPNPPSLENRLAKVEAKAQALEEAKEAADGAVKTALASLEQGEAAHETYQERLAQAESMQAERLALSKQQAETLKVAEATLAAADVEVDQANSTLSVANEKLAAISSTPQEAQGGEKPEGEEQSEEQTAALEALKKTVAEAESALGTAVAAKTQAAAGRQKAAEELEKAKQHAASAEQNLLAVSNQQAELPDLAKLQQQHDQSIEAAKKAQADANRQSKRRDALAAELRDFGERQAKLTSESQSYGGRLTELAQSVGKAQAENDAVAQAMVKQQEAIAQTQAQLESIKQRLKSLQSERRTLAENQQVSQERLAEIQGQLTEAQQAAQVAEALLRDFTAAQALREAYAE